MRKIEIQIKDLGTYKIESEDYEKYLNSCEQIRLKRSLILNKMVPLLTSDTILLAEMLNKEEYFYLREYMPLFENLYVLINTEKSSSIEERIKLMKEEFIKNEEEYIQGISFLIL